MFKASGNAKYTTERTLSGHLYQYNTQTGSSIWLDERGSAISTATEVAGAAAAATTLEVTHGTTEYTQGRSSTGDYGNGTSQVGGAHKVQLTALDVADDELRTAGVYKFSAAYNTNLQLPAEETRVYHFSRGIEGNRELRTTSREGRKLKRKWLFGHKKKS